MASSIVNFGWLFHHAITTIYVLRYRKTEQLENNCTATNGKTYTGYAIIIVKPKEMQNTLSFLTMYILL